MYGYTSEVVEELEADFQETFIVASIWTIDDVKYLCEERDIDLDPERYEEALSHFGRNEDPELGLNWDTLAEACEFIMVNRVEPTSHPTSPVPTGDPPTYVLAHEDSEDIEDIKEYGNA